MIITFSFYQGGNHAFFLQQDLQCIGKLNLIAFATGRFFQRFENLGRKDIATGNGEI
jgi:hypothetical protein